MYLEDNQGFSVTAQLINSGCSRTICRSDWFKVYTDSLSEQRKSKIIVCSSNSLFEFGHSFLIKALKRVQLPIIIADVKVMLTTDITDRYVPLLLSKAPMKKADTQINFKQDRVTMFGNDVPLQINSSGHYYITIKPSKLPHKDL